MPDPPSGSISRVDPAPARASACRLFTPVGSVRSQRVFAAVFVLLLALPMAAQLAGWNNQVSLLERREPAPFPASPLTRDALQQWPRAFDGWLVDRLGFRSVLVFAGSSIEVNWLRQSTSAAVVLGRDGWLFYAGDKTLEQMRGGELFTAAQLDRWIDRMEQRRAWLAARGIALLIVIVPNKERVYHEFMPDSAGALSPVTRLSQINRRLVERASPLNLLDLTDALVAAKDQMQVYARRDTHWSGAGAFRGYQEIMRRLQPHLPSLEPLRTDDMQNIAFTYPARDLDLMRMLGLGWAGASETLDYPLFRTAMPWTTHHEDSRVDGVARMRLTSTRPQAPTSIWFRDSFADTLAVYLNSTFRVATLVEHKGLRFDKALIEAEQPDVVIYELVERFIPRELAPD